MQMNFQLLPSIQLLPGNCLIGFTFSLLTFYATRFLCCQLFSCLLLPITCFHSITCLHHIAHFHLIPAVHIPLPIFTENKMQQNNFLGQNPFGFHRISYTHWGRTTEKTAVICVHGLTRNGRDFDWLAESLQDRYEIFCPDMAGRGKSDWLAQAALYNYPQYMSDLTALIARTGAKEIIWIGTSMGGIIGTYMAAQKNSPIKKLVINDVGPHIPLAPLQRIAEYAAKKPRFKTQAEAEAYCRQTYASFGPQTENTWQTFTKNSLQPTPEGDFTLSHDPAIAGNFKSLDQPVDFWNIYDQVQCPTLVIHGAKSDILTQETAQAMTQRGPKASLVTFENVGHAPLLATPSQISTVQNFLAS